ncbi:hypothetical protein BDZ45DRAFT_749557 [Acephala macrosclerotiorum]|nr:hypothetical protein BDZ45DRAFT_749557 [Acephala macrosclerotiorum]
MIEGLEREDTEVSAIEGGNNAAHLPNNPADLALINGYAGSKDVLESQFEVVYTATPKVYRQLPLGVQRYLDLRATIDIYSRMERSDPRYRRLADDIQARIERTENRNEWELFEDMCNLANTLVAAHRKAQSWWRGHNLPGSRSDSTSPALTGGTSCTIMPKESESYDRGLTRKKF